MNGCSITVANHGLSRLIRFVSRFTAHPCKSFINRLHLVLYACVKIFDVTFFCVYGVYGVGDKHAQVSTIRLQATATGPAGAPAPVPSRS